MNLEEKSGIERVNVLSNDQFERWFGNVVEHCPEAARHIALARPFSSAEALKEAFDNYLEELNNFGKETVLRKHPELARKLPDTSESRNEQEMAGLNATSEGDKQILDKYNDLYKEKFQFPFVICARENKVGTIISAMEVRLRNSKDEELAVAIEEVKKICRLRITDLLASSA